MRSVVIPKSVEVIEQGAFRKCENLKRVSFQAGSRLEKIGVECFECSGLEMITLPASVKEVCAHAFWQCEQLKSVRLNEGLEKLGPKDSVDLNKSAGYTFAYSAIENVNLPSTLKRLEQSTFQRCVHLKSVEIPHGVEYIGQACFY